MIRNTSPPILKSFLIYYFLFLKVYFLFCKVNFLFLFADDQVIQDARRVTGDPEYIPTDPKEFANRVFTTCYMGSENSSVETRNLAKELAGQIGR